MKLSSNRGISIVETMIAVSIMIGLALSSSYFLTNTNVITRKTEMKATIDQIHVLQVQRIRNSNAFRQNVQDSFLAQAGSPDILIFNACFDNSKTRSDCNIPATTLIQTTWATGIALPALSGTGSFTMFGEANAFESLAIWNANCLSDFCRSIDVRITTKPVTGSKYDGKLEPRVTILNFAAQLLVNQKSTRFTCTLATGDTEVAFSINNNLNRAVCSETTFVASPNQNICSQAFPMKNFGPITTGVPADNCQAPAISNCSGGVNRGYYQIAFKSSPCRTR